MRTTKGFHNLLSVFRFFLFLTFHLLLSMAQFPLPLNGVEKWAELFGRRLHELCARATALEDIRTEYLLMSPKVRIVDGNELIKDMKLKMERMLSKKVKAIQKLVKIAEQAHVTHFNDKADLLNQSEYHLSKRLNTTAFPLEEVPHFNYTAVNLATSTVHVPTNIYDESIGILTGVTWSKALEKPFVENYKEDPTLTWQYFCSTSGFLRSYPGVLWQTETFNSEKKLDVYDCRSRGWYIQAAAYPKDVVVLLDSSGSMKGLRSEIAKATVLKILDTLHEDDFVNVLNYSEDAQYVDPCFNVSMVQATTKNKQRLKKGLSSVVAYGVANLDVALTEAFELLQSVNRSRMGAQCNKAIMIVTDGAADTFKDIFERYNWPGLEIRVFTYLIGREVGDSKNVKWMACRNKGRFSHVTSLADVNEHAQSYIHVLSRPLSINRVVRTTWSNVYVDALVPGLQLMTSVAQPVFDTTSSKIKFGTILGVVGTDVPLSELIKTTPQYMLGVNGYSFAITNNGHVVFHPLFKPDLNSIHDISLAVDLTELEYTDIYSTLRNKMVDRETGNLTMSSVVLMDENKRAITRDYHYFFTDINDTPFSLGIALPVGYGLTRVDGSSTTEIPDLLTFTTSNFTLAPWNYCEIEADETQLHPLHVILKYLSNETIKGPFHEERCDKDLIRSLLFDAEATRSAYTSWKKEDYDDVHNESRSEMYGIQFVFIGTKGGLTRYIQLDKSLPDSDFIEKHGAGPDELFYSRAVENRESVFTFSVPFQKAKMRGYSPIITASTPITILDDEGQQAVAAVVGLQMRYLKFYELFINITCPCLVKDDDNCNYTCSSPEISCYLLDEHGYVILSSRDEGEVGKFFGELEDTGALMRELIIDEKGNDTGVFSSIKIQDNNALCDVYNEVVRSQASHSFDLLQNLFSTIVTIFYELVLFFLQFNRFSWLFHDSIQVGAEGESVSNLNATNNYYEDAGSAGDYAEFYEDLENYRSDPVILYMMMECAQMTRLPPSAEKRQKVQDCFDNIRSKYITRVIGQRPCVLLSTYYVANYRQLPQHGRVTSCSKTEEECTNAYSINRVPNTNLILLVVDERCTRCTNEPKVSTEPDEVKYNKTYTCQKLQTEIYRQRPKGCYDHSSEEDYSDCGLGCVFRPFSSTLLLLIATIAYEIIPTRSSTGLR